MSDPKWTQNQQNAISARNGSILVSAAAGSGKTAVLVQRVIERLTDPNDPTDADRLLIVTFTNAAAAQMRDRILMKLSKMLAEDPSNLHLERQQLLLGQAHISTIHSFCNDLIRENFFRLNISPDFRIADSSELILMKSDAINKVLEKYYSENSTDFTMLVETFSNGKNDKKLVDVIKQLHNFIMAYPYPKKWMQEKIAYYSSSVNINKTPWEMILLSHAKSTIDFCVALEEKAIGLMQREDKLKSSMQRILEEDISNLQSIDIGSRDKLKLSLEKISFSRLVTPKGYSDHPIKLSIATMRSDVKDYISMLKKLFSGTEQDCKNDLQILSSVIAKLFDVVQCFDEEFLKIKQEKNVLDFNDLEHLAVELLTELSEDQIVKSQTAIDLSKNFDEVMVDEYQDTNETQDLIFRAVSRDEQNLFVVGDVKQSIYGFRQAMPQIFLRRKNKYKKYDPKKDEYPSKIILDSNFRSREGVTEIVNFMFKQLMITSVGGLDYAKEENLVACAKFPENQSNDAIIHILDLNDSFSSDMDEVEALHIANIISKKISEKECVTDTDGTLRPIQYKDFCVLLRSANLHAKKFTELLKLHGIPAWSDVGGNFFDTTEISSIVSLLRVVDNPIQDIPLVATMMSSIFAFTSDDLAKVRLTNNDVPIYFALREYAKQSSDGRFQKFLDEMDEYRRLASIMSCSELINTIFEKTSICEIMSALPEGETRETNLKMFAKHAKSYENYGYKNLSDFIRFIDRMQENNSDLTSPNVISEFANVVKVMSIHRSKGLEFPVCFIANCARRFNKDKSDLLIHPELGVGLRTKEPNSFVYFENFTRDAIAMMTEHENLSEELRILYVAMTRAKEKLYLISSFKNVSKKLSQIAYKIALEDEILSPQTILSASSFSEWILYTSLRHPMAHKFRNAANIYDDIALEDKSKCDFDILKVDPPSETLDPLSQNEISDAQDIPDEILNRFNYQYPYAKICNVPAKISVSDLAAKNTPSSNPTMKRPSFLYEGGLTAAEKGTALHLFMQYSDFKKAKLNVKEHVDNLKNNGFLTLEQANAMDIDRLNVLFQSPLMDRLLSSNNVLREFRFTINILPKDLDPSLSTYDDNIILQGAIDCAFEENGEYIIVDYKTDKVKSMDELVKRYGEQLNLYKIALEQCLKKGVKECIIYSIYLGNSISLNNY